jgi:Asp/Glu/hydantoin racemase
MPERPPANVTKWSPSGEDGRASVLGDPDPKVLERSIGPIYVINPNSSRAVTEAISRALEALSSEGGPRICCLRLVDAPAGLETQRDVDRVVEPLLKLISEIESNASAIVIACFSDPGLHAVREQARVPVFGIMECAVLTAMTLGERFGIVSIRSSSVSRHLRYLGGMGVQGRLASDRALEMGVAELTDYDRTAKRLLEVGTELRDRDGANVVILGCAGMADHRRDLQDALGIPVVEPTQAAASMAIGRARLGW